MKTIISAALILFASTSAIAMPGYRQMTTQIHDRALTTADFPRLQQAYPKYFASYDPSTIGSASIDIIGYQWLGDTVCPKGDPRLTFESASIGVCGISKPGENTMCSQSTTTMPSPMDPCYVH